MLRAFQFRSAWNQFIAVVQRDSLSVLSGVLAFYFYETLLFREYLIFNSEQTATWLVAAASGISLFLAIRLWSRSAKEKWALSAVAFAILIGFSYRHLEVGDIRAFRFAQWFLLTHLLVALTPLRDRKRVGGGEADGQLWRFNWYLLTRFVFGGIFCGAMTLGLCGAMKATDLLFDIDFKGDHYGIVIGFVFFVVSVFQVLSSIVDTRVGPQGEQVTSDLRRLIQYLFTPLSLVYFVIAYAYIVKIALAQSWPRGVVGFLISALIGFVFLTYLMQRPLAGVARFPEWMSAFWKWSFALLIPPVIVLLLAIYRRVQEYGLTESRVVLIVLALWSLGICVYYFRPYRRGIAMIPLSLAAVVAVTFVGPLSPHSFAYRSQVNQLREILNAGGAKIVDGRYVWAKAPDHGEVNRIESILRYFCREYEPQAMFDAMGVRPAERMTGWEKSSACWSDKRHGTPFRLAQETLGLKERASEEELAADLKEIVAGETGDFSYRAGDVEVAPKVDFGYQVEDRKRRWRFGSKLRFEYTCCDLDLKWLPANGDEVRIDLTELLRDEKRKSLEVAGGGGYLTIWLTKAKAEDGAGKLRLSGNFEFAAMFAPQKGAKRSETELK